MNAENEPVEITVRQGSTVIFHVEYEEDAIKNLIATYAPVIVEQGAQILMGVASERSDAVPLPTQEEIDRVWENHCREHPTDCRKP